MIRWQREYDKTYLTIQDEHVQEDSYELKMLLSNALPGMLPLQTKKINGALLLYFDISMKQDLDVLHSRAGIKSAELKMLLSSIRSLIGTMRSYMLSGEDLILSPNYIYMDRDLHEAFFCCIPGRSRYSLDEWKEELHKLAEFILKHLDYSDPDAVLIGYDFYHRISEDPAMLNAFLEEYADESRRATGGPVRIPPDKTSPADTPGTTGRAESHGGNSYEQTAASFSGASGFFMDQADEDDEEAAAPFDKRREKGSKKKRESRKRTERKSKPEKASGRISHTKSRQYRSEGTSGKERKSHQKKQSNQRKQSNKKKILIMGALLTGAAAADFLVIWFLMPDLTSSAGVILLTLAGLWLGYRMIVPDESESSSVWDLPDEEEEEDEAWLGEILGQSAREPQPKPIQDNASYTASSLPESGPAGTSEIPHFLSGEIAGNRPGDFRGIERGIPASDPAFPGKDPATRVLAAGKSDSVLEAEGKTDDILLTGQSMILGTSPNSADHIIVSDVVSRIHARIERKEDGWMIIDLNSRNGTYVNDVQLTPNEGTLLHDGDKVVLADLRYHFRKAVS